MHKYQELGRKELTTKHWEEMEAQTNSLPGPSHNLPQPRYEDLNSSGNSQCLGSRGRGRRRENFLFSYQRTSHPSNLHKNLDPYNIVTDSSHMISTTQIRGLWYHFWCQINIIQFLCYVKERCARNMWEVSLAHVDHRPDMPCLCIWKLDRIKSSRACND